MSVVFSLLSAALLCLLLYFFIKNHRNDPWVIGALVFKIASGIALGLVYKFYYKGGDTWQYFHDAGILAGYFIENPSSIIRVLFDTTSIAEISLNISYADQPRALFFTKIVAVFYLTTGGNYWLSSAFLSLISFCCAYVFVRELTLGFRHVRLPAMVSFYFLPTFVFWTSGLLKESLAIGALLVIVALYLKIVRERNFRHIFYWIVIIASAWLLWQLKYFYAAVAFPVLFALFMYEFISRFKKAAPISVVLIFFAGITIVSQLHYNLRFEHIAEVIYQNYLMGVDGSDGGFLQFIQFDGTLISYLINLPLAVVFGLFRPMPFEAGNIFQLLVGLENAVVLILFIVAMWKVRWNSIFQSRYLLATVLFVFFLAVFLTFSTPNFGTLSRYKVAYWPFFVLLILINAQEILPDLKFAQRQKKVRP